MINLTPPPIAHAGVYELLNDSSITSIRAVQPSAFPLQSKENYLNRLGREQADEPVGLSARTILNERDTVTDQPLKSSVESNPKQQTWSKIQAPARSDLVVPAPSCRSSYQAQNTL